MRLSAAIAAVFALLALASVAGAQNPACTAKYRYQWMYMLNDPSPAILKAMDEVMMRWMKQDCNLVLSYGHGGAIPATPATFGLAPAALSATSQMADYGAWSDWASLDDLKSCYKKGLKSGNVAAIRKYGKSTSRVVYPLMTCPTAANGPATIRYMYNFKLADFSPASCNKAATLLQTIQSQKSSFVRSSYGCDAFNNDAKAYGAVVPVTANFGGFTDFRTAKDMTDFLSAKTTTKPGAARAQLRSMAASSMRGAVALLATSWVGKGGAAKVAKEGGAVLGRRLAP